MSSQYSTLRLSSGQARRRLYPWPTVPKSTKAAIKSQSRLMPATGKPLLINHAYTSVVKGKKYEAQDEEQDAVEGPVQIMREQEQERYRDAREREDQDQE